MSCIPAEINVVLEATPIRNSAVWNLAYAFRDETKKELDTIIQQGVIKPVGDIQQHGVIQCLLWKNLVKEFGFVLT